ncbi:hypothetical protein Pelo_10229 [Pelomyxa schiedti]|nr:hypothetical protein Pelo_10229 [Pelomyxa schiedti]
MLALTPAALAQHGEDGLSSSSWVSPPPGASSSSVSSSGGGMNMDLVLHAITVAGAVPLGCVTAWRLGVHVKACDTRWNRLVMFHTVLTLFYIMTLVHCTLTLVIDAGVTAFQNNICYCLTYFFSVSSDALFFTSLLVVIVYMMERMFWSVLQRQLVVSNMSRVVFWVVTSLPYLYCTATTIYFLVDPPPEINDNVIYNSAMLTICVYAFLCSICYCTVAALVLYRAYTLEKNDIYFRMPRRPLLLLILVLSTCVVCFLLQAVMFSYRPITGKLINDFIFEFFAYWLPEFGATVLLLFVVRKPISSVPYNLLLAKGGAPTGVSVQGSSLFTSNNTAATHNNDAFKRAYRESKKTKL